MSGYRNARNPIGVGLVLLVAAGGATADEAAPTPGEVLTQLRDEYPHARVQHDRGRVAMVYGVPMTPRDTPEAAAGAWLAEYEGAFGNANLTLEPRRTQALSGGEFTAFAFDQRLAGLPVEHGGVRVLVRSAGPDDRHAVVLASGIVASPMRNEAWPFDPFPEIDAGEALARAASLDAYEHLPVWNDAELVVYMGDGAWAAPRAAWKFVAESGPTFRADERYTFFVDADTGEVLKVRDEIHFADADGNASGYATPGTLPDIDANPPVLRGIPALGVAGPDGSTFTDMLGDFTLGLPDEPATVSADIGEGRWYDIFDDQRDLMSRSDTITPPDEAVLTFNQSESEFRTSQVNAAVQVTRIHNYITSRVDFPAIDVPIDTNINLTSAAGIDGCNAFFTEADGEPSINFFRQLNGCVNSNYSTVTAHEYGHFIVDRLGLAQGGFGEGYGDTVAMLLHDTPIVGEHFRLDGDDVRNPHAADQQYPCSSGSIHTCGQILAGVWYDMRDAFVDRYGTADGLERVRQLQVGWSMVTSGGRGPSTINSAHPGTAVEVLTLDDNDGVIDNGTPNYDIICQAFEGHGIDCPPQRPVIFQYPEGRPEAFSLSESTTIDLNISGEDLLIDPDLATVSYRFTDAGEFTTEPLTHLGGGSFTATIPPAACHSPVEYYFSASDGSTAATDPHEAPDETYSGVGASRMSFHDDFEQDLGWSVENGDNLIAGAWERGIPVNGGRGDPPSDFDGSGHAYLTLNLAGNSDVDGGATTLISPRLDGSVEGAALSYARWYSNSVGGGPQEDAFTVEISNDDGATWQTLEVVGPTGPEVDGGWFHKQFFLADVITPTDKMRVRFTAEDAGQGSVIEAAVDAVRVVSCEDPDACDADMNGDGSANSEDFLTFLDFYADDAPQADLTGDGVVDSQDFVEYLSAYAAGCPA